MTQGDENKAVVHRLFEEVINKGNYALADEVIATDFITHRAALATAAKLATAGAERARTESSLTGLEMFKRGLAELRQAFPDWQNIIDSLISEGDMVAGRWTAYGTHTGEFFGLAPTGKRITMVEAGMMRITNNKLAEIWVVADELGLIYELGGISALLGKKQA